MNSIPIYNKNFYSDEFIINPYPFYKEMRELGVVVYLPELSNYAITSYEESKEVLRNWRIFSSAKGVAGDEIGSKILKGNTLASDPPVHSQMRKAMGNPLTSKKLERVEDTIEKLAENIVKKLIKIERFDCIKDLASFLPLQVVTKLVGLPNYGRKNMLDWGSAAFNCLGIQNRRGKLGLKKIKIAKEWIEKNAVKENLVVDSWTYKIHELVEKGLLGKEQCPMIIRDYISPSLDTTISAIGHLVYLLGENPEEFEKLKNNKDLIDNTIEESIRLFSPIRSFSRITKENYSLSEYIIPKGSRVMILYASANRDEKKFQQADKFIINRKTFEHIGFGHGIHSCPGMHLAKLEMKSILKNIIKYVDKVIVGEPKIALNNTIFSFSELEVSFN